MATSSLQAAATLMQPTKVGRSGGASLQLRPVQGVGKAFGVEPSAARLTCSLSDFAQKCGDAAKIAGFALATSALVVSVLILLLPLNYTSMNRSLHYICFLRG